MNQEPNTVGPTSVQTQAHDVGVSASVDRTRRALVQQTALMLIGAGFLAILIASRVTLLSWQAAVVSTLGLTICAGSIALARSRHPVQIAATFLITSWLAALFATAYLRGGLSAPLMIAIPTVPVIAATVLSRRAAWIVSAAIVSGLAALYFLKYGGRSVPHALQGDVQYDLMRAFWVAVSSLMATKLATFTASRSNGLALKLERLALTDALTGIMNRGAITARLDAEITRGRRRHTALSILLLDIDHFKALNDSQGHAAGDTALKNIAGALTRLLRNGGDAVGRWGGEEFLVILPYTQPADALQVAERVRRGIAELKIPNGAGATDTVTVTIGVTGGLDVASAASLLKQADQALYRGKAGGRNRVEAAEWEPHERLKSQECSVPRSA